MYIENMNYQKKKKITFSIPDQWISKNKSS